MKREEERFSRIYSRDQDNLLHEEHGTRGPIILERESHQHSDVRPETPRDLFLFAPLCRQGVDTPINPLFMPNEDKALFRTR